MKSTQILYLPALGTRHVLRGARSQVPRGDDIGSIGAVVTTSAPRISVVMSVYNDAPFLAESITSILAQSFADFEFVIVDDGSTDGSTTIIDAFAAQDSRIRVLRHENRGLVASLNRAISEATGEWIARMDGDDVSLPQRFARQIEYLDANVECRVLGTNFYHIDDDGREMEFSGSHPLDHSNIVAALASGSPICHPSVMIARQALLANGGYRPAYKYCEDFDLWLRLSQNVCLANLPDRLLQYRRSNSQISVRQAVAQQTGAAIALLAHAERLAGRPDPTDNLDTLPLINELDAVFHRVGVAAKVRAELARNLGYSRDAMRNDGFAILTAHVRDGGDHNQLWRTVVRLILFREYKKALLLSMTLLMFRPRSEVARFVCTASRDF